MSSESLSVALHLPAFLTSRSLLHFPRGYLFISCSGNRAKMAAERESAAKKALKVANAEKNAAAERDAAAKKALKAAKMEKSLLEEEKAAADRKAVKAAAAADRKKASISAVSALEVSMAGMAVAPLGNSSAAAAASVFSAIDGRAAAALRAERPVLSQSLAPVGRSRAEADLDACVRGLRDNSCGAQMALSNKKLGDCGLALVAAALKVREERLVE